jgi:hypothetical protein
LLNSAEPRTHKSPSPGPFFRSKFHYMLDRHTIYTWFNPTSSLKRIISSRAGRVVIFTFVDVVADSPIHLNNVVTEQRNPQPKLEFFFVVPIQKFRISAAQHVLEAPSHFKNPLGSASDSRRSQPGHQAQAVPSTRIQWLYFKSSPRRQFQ